MSARHAETDLFIISGDWRDTPSGLILKFYGRSEELGPVEMVFKDKPLFFVERGVELPAEGVTCRRQDPGLKSFAGKAVEAVIFETQADCERVAESARNRGIQLFEADLRPCPRFLMKRLINAQARVAGDFTRENGFLRFKSPRIAPAECTPKFRVASLDIETGVYSGQLYSIAVHVTGLGDPQRRTFMLAERAERDGDLEFFADERSMITSFLEWFQRCDPDVLIGWNVVGFDLNFMMRKCEELKLDLTLGRARRSVRLHTNRRKAAQAQIPGRAVVDGVWALKGAFYNFEDFRLDTVARELLGHGKLITGEQDKIKEIERLFRHDKRALAAYNMQDAVLVSEIFQKTELIEHYVRRSQISGLLLEQVGLSAAALDHFYVPRLHKLGYVAPDASESAEVEPAAGGYVFTPEPGIHDNVLVLDFQSLYPSIIRTFKIDPLARLESADDPVVTPVGIPFSRRRHILPEFIAELLQKRSLARQAKQTHLSQAIKILMNSFYGVMGSSLSRFYHPDLPSAITGTGQWLLRGSQEWLESTGYHVIYGDTDSLFVKLARDEKRDPLEVGTALASDLNAWWAARLRAEFALESYLQAKFEKFYRKLLLPAARAHSGGAKKRYAGMLDAGSGQRLDFVGMEVVRSDWTKLAKHFQIELYGKVFRGEQVEAWIRDFVSELRAGRHDDKLLYRRRLQRDIADYKKSIPPYVRAAMLLAKPGREVSYYMTRRGPVPAELAPGDLDYAHYVSKQLKPIADSILCFIGLSFDEIVKGRSQLALFS